MFLFLLKLLLSETKGVGQQEIAPNLTTRTTRLNDGRVLFIRRILFIVINSAYYILSRFHCSNLAYFCKI